MTLIIERIGPRVVRLAMSGWRGRAVGYDVSAYVIGDVLVDTGFPGARDEFLAAVKELRPRGAVVTHSHEDHSGNAPALAARGLPLVMHPECETELRAAPPIGLYRRVVWGGPTRLTDRLASFDVSPLQVLQTPGHTNDHLAVWDPEEGIVASGDLFLGVKVRVAHSHESPSLLIQSLRHIASLKPVMLLDAHRGILHHPAQLIRAKVAWMEETIGEITALASEGAGEREIQRRVLGREAFVGWVSIGEYSKRAFVQVVLREMEQVS